MWQLLTQAYLEESLNTSVGEKKTKNLQCSPNALVVNTSRKVTIFECWIFFHMSTNTMHFVLTRRKPRKDQKYGLKM